MGGTSVLGRALLRRIIYISGGRGTAVLAGRKSPWLAAAAEELSRRFPGLSVRAVSGGAGSAAEIEELSERILSYGAPDVFIMALGSPADEMSAEESSSVLAEKLWVNASAPVIFLEIFFRRMREAGGGRMALFGSGAAKSLVASYAEGFSEKARGSGVTLTLIKPGPADTPLGRAAHPGKAGRLFLADPESVARRAARAVLLGRRTVYAPFWWRPLMALVRLIPGRLLSLFPE